MSSEPPPAGSTIETWTGHAYVFVGQTHEEIPEEHARQCPQCGQDAWAKSRWCRHCQWDFDKASLPKLDARKLLALSVAVNVLLAAALAALALT